MLINVGIREAIRAFAVAAVLLVGAAAGATAQETTGTITGAVKDQTGAVRLAL